AQRPDSTKPSSQFPSPMVENTRVHERIQPGTLPGLHESIKGILPRDVDLFVPKRFTSSPTFDILIHFHGADYITHHAASKAEQPLIALTVNLGSGSSVYNNGFVDTLAFPALITAALEAVKKTTANDVQIRNVVLAGFSAGYGAIRRIMSSEENYRTVDGVLLLDGIHASYVPERAVLAEGGTIEPTHLDTFLKLAAEASQPGSSKTFAITHSEVFPGTFVSTTEATDFLLRNLGMKRTPVLKWGPLGMQQLSEARKGNFVVLGFAGNSGVDHGDHLHALFHFFKMIMRVAGESKDFGH
ncbi:MAG TPA: hypothetical protein VGA55_08490, partial [Bacteroidota bacterium]